MTYNFNNVEQAFGLNNVELSKIYGSGDYLLWEKGGGTVDPDILEWELYKSQYFTIEFICNDSAEHDAIFDTQTVSWDVYYNLNNAGWTRIPAYNYPWTIVKVRNGDIMKLKQTCPNLDGSSRGPCYPSTTSYVYENIYGNIMSLYFGDNFVNHTNSLFLGAVFSNIISAKNLVLPSASVPTNGYNGTFSNCSKLIYAPTVLPATAIGDWGYCQMFNQCSSLIHPPKELGAKTLNKYCYAGMFQYCSSLSVSPKIKANTLGEGSLEEMFKSCSNLNYVYCLAENPTDIINNHGTCNNWLNGVSQTGTFVKANGVNWLSGSSGIPSGWVVQEV